MPPDTKYLSKFKKTLINWVAVKYGTAERGTVEYGETNPE